MRRQKQVYRCKICNGKIYPDGKGFWRHQHKPMDGHVPPINEEIRFDNERNSNINKIGGKIVGEIIESQINPLYPIEKGVEIAGKIIEVGEKAKKLFNNDYM